MTGYRLDLIAPPTAADAGRVIEALREADIVSDPEWVHRTYGTMSFTMPVSARRVTAVKPLESEVRVTFAESRRVWWGVVLDDEWNDKLATFHCLEIPWYLTRRFVGDEARRNWLQNPSFEGNTPGVKTPDNWSQGPDALEESRVVKSNNAILGNRFVRLTETSSDEDWLRYGGNGTAPVEDVSARLVARTNRTKSGVGQKVDGTVVEDGDRILLTSQSNSENNGIWVAAAGDWSRASNFNTDDELRPGGSRGARVKISAGVQYADTGWEITNSTAITVDTDAIFISQYAYTRVRPRDSYLKQTELLDVGTRRGSRWTGRAWFRIKTLDAPPRKERGLMVELINDDTGKVMRRSVFNITDETQTGKWLRAEASLRIPRKVANPKIRVYLYCPTGVIEWDAAGLFYREALLDGDTDVVDAFKSLVDEAQNKRRGKPTLRIKVTGRKAGRATGKRYFFDSHPNVMDELEDLPVDWWFDASSRTIRTFGRGREVNRDITFEIGRNVGTFTVRRSGTDTVNRVITLARGEGAAREEGSASRPGRFSGMVYEDVVAVTAKLRALDNRAEAIVDRRGRLVQIPEMLTDGNPALVGRLRVGDRHPVTLRAGKLRYSATPRIERLQLRTATNEYVIKWAP